MGNCYNRIEINAPIGKVWETIRDFHDTSWASGVITDIRKVGDKNGTELGAQRILNGVFHETLKTLDSGAYTFSYSIDEGPGPVASSAVSNYTGLVKLSESGSGTVVEWSSTFESANENEVADFCNPIYSALLAALKTTLS